ncbi:MAG: transketolase [Chloroflexi bacterium]|nr:MAG: transketolase [Chloroflexota bacterium]MBL1193725.1 transketolase [Chloroflexota bacterium]NOH11018.1 transketolase [Chloroflexota bacterium]
MASKAKQAKKPSKKINFTRAEVLVDYRLAYQSRQASLIGRREVLTGKAKFGIFGDGKEVANIAMSKYFQPGDWRSGYYRDQTFMFAIEEHSIQEYFAQLYADGDVGREPATAGRSMNAHFATRSLNSDGSWKNLMEIKNSSADVSPTASQMPRLVGLAHASRLYREVEELREFSEFSDNGNEVAFGTIGNASTAEGMFWESINAIGVLQAPAVISIWDDGYGISVPSEYQSIGDLSVMLSGFGRTDEGRGFNLFSVSAWDYAGLIKTYQSAVDQAREDHIPALIHVKDVTQPQGHSTSGSHERYKSIERLAWEEEYDCLPKMRAWIMAEGFATDEELEEIETKDRVLVEGIRKEAWNAFQDPIKEELSTVVDMLDEIVSTSAQRERLAAIKDRMMGLQNPVRRDVMVGVREILLALRYEGHPNKQVLIDWKKEQDLLSADRYNSHLLSSSSEAAVKVAEVKPVYADDAPRMNGFQILQKGFDAMLDRDARVSAFGEDVGFLGGVNQGMAGLQEAYGGLRVADTGIREVTIMGQAIGMAMRGLRPIAEIQYLDYVLYALQIMSDDLATLRWRTKGGQKAPVIIRTRGHRLEGIWHSGSLMAGILNLVRGMYVLVPRNMVQAVGFYNTLLLSDDPGIVVEVLNGYRLKERLPDNYAEFTVPLGVPKVLREGSDITVVTYGPLCRIASQTADLLEEVGISVELIDVRSLLPFDIFGSIVESLKKTNRILFLDEDVPGGTTAYMMQEVIEKQGGYYWLDSEPRTMTAKEHRPAYGTDGDYWSKPNAETIFETIYEMMHEVDPGQYPLFYK